MCVYVAVVGIYLWVSSLSLPLSHHDTAKRWNIMRRKKEKCSTLKKGLSSRKRKYFTFLLVYKCVQARERGTVKVMGEKREWIAATWRRTSLIFFSLRTSHIFISCSILLFSSSCELFHHIHMCVCLCVWSWPTSQKKEEKTAWLVKWMNVVVILETLHFISAFLYIFGDMYTFPPCFIFALDALAFLLYFRLCYFAAFVSNHCAFPSTGILYVYSFIVYLPWQKCSDSHSSVPHTHRQTVGDTHISLSRPLQLTLLWKRKRTVYADDA